MKLPQLKSPPLRIGRRILFGLFGAALWINAHANSNYEIQVINAIEKIQNGDILSSVQLVDQFTEIYPNSKIGQLLLADLYATKAGTLDMIANIDVDHMLLDGLRSEIDYRWQHNKTRGPALAGLVPSNLILSAPDQEYVLVVDTSNARLWVYRNLGKTHQLVDDFYITIGKFGTGKIKEGDQRTPLGVYYVTSYIPGDGLPDRYGPGAFPINYPNKLDRLRDKSGYGIWIHGTEQENYNRVPLASDGCVSLSNDDLLKIGDYINTDGSTPVIIADNFEWVDPVSIEDSQLNFKALLQQWRHDWESLEFERYMRHYSKTKFINENFDYENWSARKKVIGQSKEFIQVEIKDLSIFSYPGEQNMVAMSFIQEFASNNHKDKSKKFLYWQQNDMGDWKIIYEGT